YALSWLLVYLRAPPWGVLIEQALAITLCVVFVGGFYRARESGWVHADGSSLRLNGRVLALRRRGGTAYLLPIEQPAVHVVVQNGLHFDVRFEDEAAARRFLDTIGFGIGQSMATFRAAYGSLRQRLSFLFLFLLGVEVIAFGIHPFGSAGLLPTY